MEDSKSTTGPGGGATRGGRKSARSSTSRKGAKPAKAALKPGPKARTQSVAKSAATGKARASAASRTTVTDEDRRNMVSIAAYFRAERRGFAPGHEDADWLAAEAEVDAQLAAIPGKRPSQRRRKLPVS